MRRITELLGSRAERERGATMVMVAVMLTVLMGFAGLAVDGAAMMAKEQELQNGADAAALAAAQEAAADDCTALYCANAASVADPYGAGNVRNENGAGNLTTTFDFNNPSQTVTATVTGRQTHWFMPILGIDSSDISASATAEWFTPTGGPSMLPLAISQCSFEYQANGDPVEIGDTIAIWIPKDNRHTPACPDSSYPPGGFGWLDPSDGACESDITVGGWAGGDTGNTPKGSCEFEDFIGETVLIPIFIDNRGEGESAEVLVTQFAAFEVHRLEIQSEGSWGSPSCPSNPVPNGLHDTCLLGKFVEYVSSAEGYEGDDSESEVAIVRLIN